jgi:hypothetical protein
MKITIEPETDDERKALAEPWVRTGCIRFGLSGITDKPQDSPTPEFGFIHGDGVGVRGDMARIVAMLENQAMRHAAVNGLLNAQQIVANAQRDEALANEIRNGKPFKLHRP